MLMIIAEESNTP